MNKRIGLIGYGAWGKNYINTLVNISGAELVWLCSPHQEVSPDDLSAGCMFTHNYSDILDDRSVEAVIIATPPHTHFKLTQEAILADKDVLVEKPMTLDPREAFSLFELAQKKSRVLMVGHIFLYNPALIELKKMIERGDLGELRYILSRRAGPGPVRDDVNVMWNLLPHDVSIANYLIGSLPVEVCASGESFLKKGKEDVADTVLSYQNGTKTFVHNSWIEPIKVRDILVVGERKTAIFDDMSETRLLIVDNAGGEPVVPVFSPTSPLEEECRHFLNCLNRRNQPITDGYEGYLNTEILFSAQTSLKNKTLENISYKARD